jgi:hypothetical protein
MIRFLKYLGFIFFVVVMMLLFLDYSYTKVFENSNPRTKFQYFRSLENKKINYIFLGSSRVENTIVTGIIEKQTGKSAVNLGFQAVKLGDLYTMLKLVKKYNIQSDKIFIQVDYIFNSEDGYSNVMQYELIPFIRENEITKEYFERHFKDEKEMYYCPFYRYIHFEPKIGLREFVLNIANKETDIIKSKGFVALHGNSSEHINALPIQINDTNKYYNKIIEFAKINNMPVVFFCAPFCKHTKNLKFMKKLKLKIPGLYDFSGVINDDKMFANCSHLNQNGANYFTKYIIKNILIDN